MSVDLARRQREKTIAPLSEEDWYALRAGTTTLIDTLDGLQPAHVDAVRAGVAYDDSTPPQPYETPVVEAHLPGRRVLCYSIADCYKVVEPPPPREAR